MTTENNTWFMYVLQCTDERQSLYCGISTDVERRVKEHNQSKRGAKYTRARRPVYLLFTQEFNSRSSALKAEAAFKNLSRAQKYSYMARECEKRLIDQIKANNIHQEKKPVSIDSTDLSSGSIPQ